MAQTGWYDDPDGTPGRLRFWDGAQWSAQTRPKSDAVAPGSGAGSADQTAVLPSVTDPSRTAVLPSVRPYQGGAPYGSAPYGSSAPQAGYGAYGTGSPYGGQAYPQAPQPPYGHPQPPYRGTQPPRKGGGRTAAVVLVLLAALVGVAVAVNAFTNKPTPVPTATTKPAGSDPTAFPTITMPTVTVPGQTVAPTIPEPAPETSTAGTTACPAPVPGQLSDGVITVSLPASWETADAGITWADCYAMGDRVIVKGWTTSALVAVLPSDGASAEQTAGDVWAWNAKNNYGSLSTITGANITKSGPVTIGSHQGFKLTGQVLVKDIAGVPGDDVTILVIDNADKTQSILLTASTVGDQASTDEVAAIWASLKVS